MVTTCPRFIVLSAARDSEEPLSKDSDSIGEALTKEAYGKSFLIWKMLIISTFHRASDRGLFKPFAISIKQDAVVPGGSKGRTLSVARNPTSSS
jgi:hypothetical protein